MTENTAAKAAEKMDGFAKVADHVKRMGQEESTVRIRELIQNETYSCFELGALLDLHKVHEVAWHGKGKHAFRTWVIEDLKVEWPHARQVMLTFRKLKALEVREEQLADVCWSKVVLICRLGSMLLNQRNVGEWFEKGRVMTVEQLREEIRAAKGKETMAEKAERIQETTYEMIARIPRPRAEVCRQAHEKMEEAMGSQFPRGSEGSGEFFLALCRDYLAPSELPGGTEELKALLVQAMERIKEVSPNSFQAFLLSIDAAREVFPEHFDEWEHDEDYLISEQNELDFEEAQRPLRADANITVDDDGDEVIHLPAGDSQTLEESIEDAVLGETNEGEGAPA